MQHYKEFNQYLIPEKLHRGKPGEIQPEGWVAARMIDHRFRIYSKTIDTLVIFAAEKRRRELAKGYMKPCTKEEFERVLAAHPLAIPDGFCLVGSLTQSRWFLNGEEIARESWDSTWHLYDVNEDFT